MASALNDVGIDLSILQNNALWKENIEYLQYISNMELELLEYYNYNK